MPVTFHYHRYGAVEDKIKNCSAKMIHKKKLSYAVQRRAIYHIQMNDSIIYNIFYNYKVHK